MKNLTRAQRKKAMKQFKIGDLVTWGSGVSAHRVVDVTDRGVIVDISTLGLDGRYFLTVLYDKNMQGNGPRCRFREQNVQRGPIRHAVKEG